MVLETKRLYLRELTEADFDALYRVLADSDIMQHYPYTFDEARVRGWIQKNIERYSIFGFGLCAVCLRETGDMIGDCGLTMQPDRRADQTGDRVSYPKGPAETGLCQGSRDRRSGLDVPPYAVLHGLFDHFLKVYAFAKTLGEAEGLDARTQETLELAAVVHDIACPLCREKYVFKSSY